MMTRCLPILLLALLAWAGGCDDADAPALPTTQMKIGNRTFVLEIARTPAQQEKGLMKRDSMPADHGMIFVFDDDQVREFWMKNTRIPLDIIFVDSGGKVVSIRQMKPYDEHLTSSDDPARYAIELNLGAAADSRLKKGDVLQIPPAARSTGK